MPYLLKRRLIRLLMFVFIAESIAAIGIMELSREAGRANFLKIKAGMTRNEVDAILGNPLAGHHGPHLGPDKFVSRVSYVYQAESRPWGRTDDRILVFFDENDIVRDQLYNPSFPQDLWHRLRGWRYEIRDRYGL